MYTRAILVFCVTLVWGLFSVEIRGDELKVGAAAVDITPSDPVYLAGWTPYRISQGIETPLKANIIALESTGAKGESEMAVIIAFDLISIRSGLLLPLRKAIAEKFPDFDLEKFLFCATHTHCAPLLDNPGEKIPDGVISPSEYVRKIIPSLLTGIESAWNSRQKVKFSYGLGNAVVACNRVTVYDKGRANMYGKTGTSLFRAIESVEDHEVGTMFFWDKDDHLIATVVNVACPAQENERHNNCYISSDYWGKVRDRIHQQYGKDVVVAGLCSAAGDASPHQHVHIAARERMTKLRNLSPADEIARRIFQGIEEVYPLAFKDRKDNIVMKHRYAVLVVPQRIPTKGEYQAALAENERLGNVKNTTTAGNNRLIDRYKALEKNPHPVFKTPINVLRIGDTVLCTNQFEFYTEYGIQIKARSKAVQTFVAQLTNGGKNLKSDNPNELDAFQVWGSAGSYLPTDRGVQGGAYGALLRTNIVGPEGGQMIVNETVKMIKELWE